MALSQWSSPGRILVVSELYNLRMRIEEKIRADRLDEKGIKGQIALRSGKLLAFITPTSPDDPAVAVKLRMAAKAVLKIDL